MCLWVSCMKKISEIFFAYWRSLKKGVGSGAGSITQWYGSGDPDPDPNSQIPNTAQKSQGPRRTWFPWWLGPGGRPCGEAGPWWAGGPTPRTPSWRWWSPGPQMNSHSPIIHIEDWGSFQYQCCQIRACFPCHSSQKPRPLGDLSWPLNFFFISIPLVLRCN